MTTIDEAGAASIRVVLADVVTSMSRSTKARKSAGPARCGSAPFASKPLRRPARSIAGAMLWPSRRSRPAATSDIGAGAGVSPQPVSPDTTGSAGGRQGTARNLVQMPGATSLALVFQLRPDGTSAAAADARPAKAGFALAAAVASLAGRHVPAPGSTQRP